MACSSPQQSPLQLGLEKIVASIVVVAAAAADVPKAIDIAVLDLYYQPAVDEVSGSLSGTILLMVVETPAVNDEID